MASSSMRSGGRDNAMTSTCDSTIDLRTPLHRHFGHCTFRSGQQQVVAAVLSGRDVLAVMPTGSGKSLGYQLPAVILPGTTLVVSPLISLMKDQVDELNRRGIPSGALHSMLSSDGRREVLDAARSGRLRLLYVAPERFASDEFVRLLRELTVARFVIDEAHCVSEWGHDFRPDYRRLRAAAAACRTVDGRFARPPIAAFTATATPEVRDDIVAMVGLETTRDPGRGFRSPEHPPPRRTGRGRGGEARASAAAGQRTPRARVCGNPPEHGGSRGDPAGGRRPGRRVSCGNERRRAYARAGRVRCRVAGGRVRDQRVRDGHRPPGRGRGDPLRDSRIGRSLLPGDRPCRPRWTSGDCDAALGLCRRRDAAVSYRQSSAREASLRSRKDNEPWRSNQPGGGRPRGSRAPEGNRAQEAAADDRVRRDPAVPARDDPSIFRRPGGTGPLPLVRHLRSAGDRRVRTRARAQDPRRSGPRRRTLRPTEDRRNAGRRHERPSARPRGIVDYGAAAPGGARDARRVDRCGHRRRLDRGVERQVPERSA